VAIATPALADDVGVRVTRDCLRRSLVLNAALHGEDETALTMRPTRMTIWPTA
jgi:hypothetical protein